MPGLFAHVWDDLKKESYGLPVQTQHPFNLHAYANKINSKMGKYRMNITVHLYLVIWKSPLSMYFRLSVLGEGTELFQNMREATVHLNTFTKFPILKV